MNNEITYTHRTRSGLKARILSTDIKANCPVLAAILHGDNTERIVQLYRDLSVSLDALSAFDLFEYNAWQDVAVDTAVYVSSSPSTECWKRRHFAKFEQGKVYVWEDGRTSWTTLTSIAYKYAKLVTE